MKILIELSPGDRLSDVPQALVDLVGEAALEAEPGAVEPLEKKAPAAKEAPTKEKETGPTLEGVRQALRDYAAINGQDEAVKILHNVGEAETMSSMDPSKYEAVLKALSDG